MKLTIEQTCEFVDQLAKKQSIGLSPWLNELVNNEYSPVCTYLQTVAPPSEVTITVIVEIKRKS